MDLQRLLQRAESSSVHRWILNQSLNFAIPFNRPHGVRVLEISNNHLKVELPYRRSNFNHIKGLHACALATVSEFTTGLLLIKRLGSKYRLIMQKLEMEYHYQGKMDAHASFRLEDLWLQENVFNVVEREGVAVVPCKIDIHDAKGNHLTTGNVFWQIKEWTKVRTKVS